MNYFEFYNIPVSFLPDEVLIKRTFYKLSKTHHPDFFTLENKEKQEEVLELSTINNNAFKVLSDFDARMKYILDLKGVLEEEGKATVPQEFLMEMMEVNEQLMELQFDFDAAVYKNLVNNLDKSEKDMMEAILPTLEKYDAEKSAENELLAVKDYYLKKRYLLRIRENLDKFAAI